MLSPLYQKECLPTTKGCGNCKFVEALYTDKLSLHWFNFLVVIAKLLEKKQFKKFSVALS